MTNCMFDLLTENIDLYWSLNYHLSPRYSAVKSECLSPVDGHHGFVQVGVLEAGLGSWNAL